jgi:hypothetical protein
VPRKPKNNEQKEGEYLIDDFKKNKELWGIWTLEILSEDEKKIIAIPKEKIRDRDKEVEETIKRERFMELYNVNKEEFLGTYEIYDHGKDMLIYVNTDAINEDVSPHIVGEKWIKRFMHGETWKFKLESIIFDKDGTRIPLLKAIEHVKVDGKSK